MKRQAIGRTATNLPDLSFDACAVVGLGFISTFAAADIAITVRLVLTRVLPGHYGVALAQVNLEHCAKMKKLNSNDARGRLKSRTSDTMAILETAGLQKHNEQNYYIRQLE